MAMQVRQSPPDGGVKMSAASRVFPILSSPATAATGYWEYEWT